MADILGLAQYVQQQGATGKEAGQKSRLARLYSQALAAPDDQRNSYLPQMAAEDPATAMQAQGQFNGMRKDAYDDLGREANMFVAQAQSGDPATTQAAYQRLAQKAQAAGHPVPPNYDPKMLPMIEKLAGTIGGGDEMKSLRVGANGNFMAIRNGQLVDTGIAADTRMQLRDQPGIDPSLVNLRTGAQIPLGGVQQQAAPTPAPGEVPFTIDPSLPPEVRAQIRANPQAGSAQGVTALPQAGAPQATNLAAQRPLPAKAPSALDERIAKARQMGATPEQIKQMVVGSAGQASAPDVPGDTSKTGNAYLSTLPQQTASQVRALADGRMQFPSGTALKSPYWQGMLSAVSQYDPNFDAVNYNARSNTRKAFTSGKEAQTVNALNTVAEHLGKFSDNAAALHNTGFPLYNRIKNFAMEQSGDPRIAAFNTNKKAVADEVAKVWRATGGSEADIQENLKNLDGAQSPEQLNAAIGTLTQLIYGKVAALQDQYASGMGTTQTPRPLVSKGAQAAFDKTLQRMSGGAPAKSTGPKVIRYDAQGNRIP